MGLSILMQNLAHAMSSADLWTFLLSIGRAFIFGPFYAKPELLIGFGVSVIVTFGLRSCLRRPISARRSARPCRTVKPPMLMGIPVPRIFLITFAVGSALVGFSACIMMPLFSVFPTVGLNFVLIAFVVVVLGGMGEPRRRVARRHVYRRRAIAERLFHCTGLRPDVLLYPVPLGHGIPTGRPPGSQGEATLGMLD